MRTIAITNQKGGCGKTTTAVNLAAVLARLGDRVLLVDLDSQAHSTLGLGFASETVRKSIYDVLVDDSTALADAMLKTNVKGLALAPSNILLSGVEFELEKIVNREYTLKQQLVCVSDSFDICVIDCSPSLSLLTLNALVASDGIIIPVQTHYYAIEGLKQLLETVDIVTERFNRDLKILGLLLTFFEHRTILSRQIHQQMKDFFGAMLFDTVIHRTVRLAEAPAVGKPVFAYAPCSRAAAEYMSLAEEVISTEFACQELNNVKV